MKFSANHLQIIYEALKKPYQPHVRRALSKEICSRGWATTEAVFDWFAMMDSRLWELGPAPAWLLTALSIHPTLICNAPSKGQRSVVYFDGLTLVDIAALGIRMRQLGFCIDTDLLAEMALPLITSKKWLTQAELHLYWYKAERDNHEITASVDVRPAGQASFDDFKSANGQSISVMCIDGMAHYLHIKGRKFKTPQPVVATTCEYCGTYYLKGDPESSAHHRSVHARLRAVMEPKPNARYQQLLEPDSIMVAVTDSSPRWMQKEMYERAYRFKNELGFDFVMWDQAYQSDPLVNGYLLSFPDGHERRGQIAGACAFRYREHGWAMQWIWIMPAARRHGLLSLAWPEFRKKYGDFHVERPLSDAMAGFLKSRGYTG